jgi:hypothetical protein
LALHALVAQRAARQLRRAIPVVVATAVAVTAATTVTAPARAAYAPRVVIVVGPAGGSTADYLSHAHDYARQARAYGASVAEIYTPHATWPRVLSAAQGANVFIYLGHGNGWPSPYAPWQTRTKDGMGLNPYDGAGNGNVKYYGEAEIQASIRLAPGAVVLLNRLCYASGNAEPGMAEPTWTTAIKRVDNYQAGFMRTGASVVLADGHTSLAYELAVLFHGSQSVWAAWSHDPDANGHTRAFDSARNSGVRLFLDPDRARAGFYRSLAVRPGATTGSIRIAAYAGAMRSRAALRGNANASARVLGSLAKGERVVMRGSLVMDGAGRTWTPVMTRSGHAGWVAGWNVAYAGTARTGPKLILRATPSLHGARRGTVAPGARVAIVGSARDTADRAWLKVVSSGRTGWIAAWLTKP